jgi:hypothetical protein
MMNANYAAAAYHTPENSYEEAVRDAANLLIAEGKGHWKYHTAYGDPTSSTVWWSDAIGTETILILRVPRSAMKDERHASMS